MTQTTEVLTKTAKDPKTFIKEWQSFYLKYFGIRNRFDDIKIPQSKLGFDRLILIAKDLNLDIIFKIMLNELKIRNSFPEGKLDDFITFNARNAQKSYAISLRDNIEPDPEYLGKSTCEADPDGKLGCTLLERLILELKYFSETGGYLDIKGWTLCTGSSGACGIIPYLSLLPDSNIMGIGFYSPEYSYPNSGIREVVSY